MMLERTVLLVSANDLGWAQLRASLRDMPGVRVVDTTNPQKALGEVDALQPALVVVGAELRGVSTVPLIQELRTTCPISRILIFAARHNPARPGDLIELAHLPYLSYLEWSELSPSGLYHTLAALLDGPLRVVTEPVAATYVEANNQLRGQASTRVRLTARERDVVTLLGGGATDKEVAECLGITTSTVQDYVQRLSDKLRARTRVQLGVMACQCGLLQAAGGPEVLA